MVIAPSFNASTQPGHTTLRVAVRDTATGMVPVLYINTLTHSHRNRLDHYVLDRYSTTSSNRDSNWFVGSFDIPEGITDMVGIIPLPADSFDDGAQPGADRKAYKALRENVRPVWTSVEVMKFGNGELNALVNAGQLQRRPTQQSINQQRFYKDELKGILDSAIDAWLYLPCEHSVDSVLLVSDGRAYIDGAKLLPHVNSANTAVVLFAPKAEDDRQVLLGNLEKLVTALKEHILPWAKEQAQHSNYEWPERSEAFTIAGGSLGGYAAAAIVLHHPEIALNAIVQSASLWWPDRHFRLLEDWVNRLQALMAMKESSSMNTVNMISNSLKRMKNWRATLISQRPW